MSTLVPNNNYIDHTNLFNVKYKLGKLCKNNHLFKNTNKSPRYINNSACIICDRDRKKILRKNKIYRSNNSIVGDYFPPEIDVKTYKEAKENELWIDLDQKIDLIDFNQILNNKGRRYQASTWGRIRYKTNKIKDWSYIIGYDNNGYRFTRILGKAIGIHRIVCFVFCKDKENTKQIVLHKDDNKKANYPSNLKWGSHSENTISMYKNNRYGKRKKIIVNIENEDEEWRYIENSCDFYVSSLGRVKHGENFISLKENCGGYVVCSLKFKTNQKAKTNTIPRTVHTLIGDAFLGRKNKFQHIRHLDGDKKNNKLYNLVLGDAYSNAQDRFKSGKYHTKNTFGPSNSNAKLTSSEEDDIKQKILLGHSLLSIANEYNVSDTSISRIKSKL